MANLERSAVAEWRGDLRGGSGKFSATSGVFQDAAYSFATRFENAPGTNPEEMIASAEAACFSMAFANELSKAGFKPDSIRTTATVIMSPKPTGGWGVSGIRLETEGKVPNVDNDTFQKIAEGAKKGCPISTLLLPGLPDGINLNAKLV